MDSRGPGLAGFLHEMVINIGCNPNSFLIPIYVVGGARGDDVLTDRYYPLMGPNVRNEYLKKKDR